MGKDNTGIPWPRGYYDLERGRPAVPRVGVFRARITGYHGEVANLNLLDEKLQEIVNLLKVSNTHLESITGENIKKEEV